MRDSGERLKSVRKQLIKRRPIFQHKNVQKLTWDSPDGRPKNNKVIINNKWRRSLNDVRAKPGTDVASAHPHILEKRKLKFDL